MLVAVSLLLQLGVMDLGQLCDTGGVGGSLRIFL